MKVITDIRKSTPAMAVVGVTDLATQALRTAQADLTARVTKAQGQAVAGVETLRAELAPAKVQANVQNLPNLAISKALEVAGKAEETYGELASRGKSLVTSVRRGSATADLLAQSRSTLTLGKAAVTTVRKASDETLVAAKATLTAGRNEATELIASVVRGAESEVAAAPEVAKAAKAATQNTRSAAKRTVTTATTRGAKAKKATKAVRTSAGKTTATAGAAAKSAVKSTGRTPARKTAARKTTARKTDARKTTARKTTAS